MASHVTVPHDWNGRIALILVSTQDNALVHAAEITVEDLQEGGIPYVTHLSIFPDPNVIEIL